jgi:two-component system catabolic regulation response regulator CreB
VLVVDDDWGVREIAALFLDRAGYLVTLAAGLQAGLRVLTLVTPDVILTELKLPDGSGREVISLAAGMPRPPKVVVMSEALDDRGRAAVMADGTTRVLAKLFLPRELFGVVYAATYRGPMSGARNPRHGLPVA